ncbi:Xaa-Pro aminopeptidase [Tistlia consotensis]|uniref:Xaa-Pro aminopeptidase n=1 Tax=Tistlia consotensis USBA 355 TaxID=560819 RepID=A0A1Y6CE51_9PROT|nr:Xaa-Pro peptidase family protein [Tistlia consotensis]SMF51517.1 Xaa-Pro aminopeptidase [Tistlia consotensis USBA 355]SNR84111.1 Xaa-Pro aminopeptidase [Tistlia consotensis]
MSAAGEAPPRGFPTAEFEARLERAQRLMAAAGLDALFLTTEPEIRWFTGFLTLFWQSPTRPWFLVVPRAGKPVAVVPEIGAPVMARTWIEDIRAWPAPQPEDDGLSLLAGVFREIGAAGGRIGLPMGPETTLRMPLADFERLRAALPEAAFLDATPAIRALRRVKSEREIAKTAHICRIASEGFAALPGLVGAGMPLTEVFRAFRLELIRRGADDVPYLVGAAAPGGYDDVISPPSERPLASGDLLMMDTGATFDGYFCDFDRNVAIGRADAAAARAYDTLWRATEAGLAAARPGQSCAGLFRAMQAVIEADGYRAGNVGRMGHGLGLQLTEHPSNAAWDGTVLEPGMVLTLEPGLAFAPGRGQVHEENLVVRADGAELLSRRAPRELPVI